MPVFSVYVISPDSFDTSTVMVKLCPLDFLFFFLFCLFRWFLVWRRGMHWRTSLVSAGHLVASHSVVTWCSTLLVCLHSLNAHSSTHTCAYSWTRTHVRTHCTHTHTSTHTCEHMHTYTHVPHLLPLFVYFCPSSFAFICLSLSISSAEGRRTHNQSSWITCSWNWSKVEA